MNLKMPYVTVVVRSAAVILILGTFCHSLQGAVPSVEQSLRIVPIQHVVNYYCPKSDEIPKCKIISEKFDNNAVWFVEGPDGAVLRKFVDTNGDNTVDQLCYYMDGVEVYRDIDSKFSGKADHFLWFNMGETRWGVDENKDGKIDLWKVLSPEEATAEVVVSLANRVSDRFASILLAPGLRHKSNRYGNRID
jgi:hypothetical protein